MGKSRITNLVAMLVIGLLLSGCRGNSVATGASSNSSQQPEERKRFDGNCTSGLCLVIEIKATYFVQTPDGTGEVRGTVDNFTAIGRTYRKLELLANDIENDSRDHSAWIVTKDYGRIRIGGAYDRLCYPPNLPHYTAPVCFWLTPSQQASLVSLSKAPPKDIVEAATLGDLAAAQEMIAKGADVNAKNQEGTTALQIASMNNHLSVVQALLAAGADVNAKFYRGETALESASMNNNLTIVQALLTAGAQVNAKDADGYTALIYASGNGNLEVVKTLLAKGADVNAKGNDGKSALSQAIERHRVEVKTILLQSGAKP